ncbi:sensor histidine kinase [Thiocystis violacea]|uniref:sensor histidine kinase n=1 Tax=Thiocystis violacea TaxID=13725 RepID=UPI001905F2E9|nr:HAMP domain-containing sensor histidine kinase [Thiocystis violacea]MBK1718509.1 two-component sensor histidine kinase [Thiocystis violacea]
MRRGSEHERARTRLRLGIGLFILALAAPSLLLVHKAYDQIKWESFRQQQLAAEELAGRIDGALAALIAVEDSRPIEDYAFLTDRGDPARPYPRRSPLSDWPVDPAVPGLIGWFQVAADGRFGSPLVPEPGVAPADHGVTPADLARRQATAQRIQRILVGNRLVERNARESDLGAPSPSPTPGTPEGGRADEAVGSEPTDEVATAALEKPEKMERKEAPSRLSQAAFERLASDRATPKAISDKAANLGRVDDLELDVSLAERARRKEPASPTLGASDESEPIDAARPAPSPLGRDLRTQARPAPGEARQAPSSQSVRLFETAVEPFEVGLLDSGHLLLFRTVWRGGERLIQGALIEQAAFLERLVGAPLAATSLARTTHLIAAYRGAVLATFRAEPLDDYRSRAAILTSGAPPLTGALLYRARLPEPFGGLELIFTVSRLPTPAGAVAIGWMAAALALVLLAGGWLMYRLGLSQLALIRQQQDFVSAVSHELKTPLTSIRMYAEMLRAGFATEERKTTYYRYIHEESERLSRLIANVLQLARIGRDNLALEPRPVAIGELLAMVRERVASQVERAGFRLEMGCESQADVLVDPDAFVQILINLVDNAIKFAANAEPRRIRIGCEELAGERLRVSVRDFGPGIAREQRQQVFQLFYRGAEARSQAIGGTGIGLALVRRLTLAMGGRVEVIGADPGAEFRLELPLARTGMRVPPARIEQ